MGATKQRAVAEWTKTSYGVVLRDGGSIVVCASRHGSNTTYETIDASDEARMPGASDVVAGCLSERESFARWLTAPFPSVHKAMQVFPSLLDIQLPFPVEDCVHQFVAPSVTAEQTTRALAVAARLSDIEKKIAAYAEYGLDPMVLDQEGIALWSRSCAENPIEEGTTRTVVYVSGDRMTLAVGRHDEFLGAHNVGVSSGHLERVLQSSAGCNLSSLQWAWCGPDADVARVDAIAAELGEGWSDRSFIHDDPATFLARSVALRAITPGLMRCNLRAGKYEHAQLAERTRQRSRKAAAVSILAGIVLSVVSLLLAQLSDARVARAGQAFIGLAEEMVDGNLGGNRGKDALERVEKHVRKDIQLSRAFTAAFEPSLTAALKEMTDAGAGGQLAYSFVMLRDGLVQIMGTARSRKACDTLLNRLQDRLGLSLNLHSSESSTGGDIQFSIKPGGPRG